jgi:Mg2+-importing ATPase
MIKILHELKNNQIEPFWQHEPAFYLKKFQSSEHGLTQNQLSLFRHPHPQRNSLLKRDSLLLLTQFKSPLMLLLIGAVVLSAFLGDTSDVFIILFIVFSTGLLSFFQERNANRIAEKLQHLLQFESTVIRDARSCRIKSNEVISGDIVVFKAGDMIPADCLLLESNELHVNEASLTGESYPVRKEIGILSENTSLSKRTNCLWEGTNVVSGNARAIAILTGENTLFGDIAQHSNQEVETAFEKGIKDFGFFLMKITLVLSAIILMINLLNHKSPIESALFALALAVGMAPELLPAITTIAMSVGAKKMLQKKVIVKKLSSIQNLGEVDLLCTDKTGTITEGLIEVMGLVGYDGIEENFVKKLAYWNAIHETGYENPIDEALKKINLVEIDISEKIGEIPYDFLRKRLSISIQVEEKKILITKGAFDQVFNICSHIRLNDQQTVGISNYQDLVQQRYTAYGEKGIRVIGICYKEINQDSISILDEVGMVFAGFILLQDPIKVEIKETITELQKLKIGLKIITGDNVNVARAIALQIGISNPVILSGANLIHASTEALDKLVTQTHIFAEVEPQQKERIIYALRKSYTVAYIGDGINDVSALRAADVGISVENAVDVAREAADFVLMKKDLRVLIDGIREGRKTFANTLKYIFINTGSTFGNMFSVAAASLILSFLPMLPKQILLMNFITDFPYLMVASDNVDQEQLDKPGKWDLTFIRKYMLVFGIHSSLFDLITFLTLIYVLKVKESAFQTGWFVESILTELFILFIIRTHKNFYTSKPGFYLFVLSILGLMATLILPYLPFAGAIGLSPLPWLSLGMMLLIVTLYILSADALKVWFFKRMTN